MRCAFMLVALAVAGCTNGGVLAAGPAGGGDAQTVDVNLSMHPGGYAPDTLTVAVGTHIRFVNSDSFAHTATLIAGAQTFPAGSPFGASAQTQSGATLSQAWSSGTLEPNGSSQTLTVDAPGTYLYGCFYHYGSPMRGTIVAQ